MVRLQNLSGPYPKRWDNTGVVVEAREFDQYIIKMHGSGRLVTRNHQFLREIIPFGDCVTKTHGMTDKQSDKQIVEAEPEPEPRINNPTQ